MVASNRDAFSPSTKASLAKRSGFLCAYCRALTIGPSANSAESVTNLGVGAHITAASPGGPRYDASLTPLERSSLNNGIWLCQNHAKQIDDDCVSWTVTRLRDLKSRHEDHVTRVLGLPVELSVGRVPNFGGSPAITPRQYGFVDVRNLVTAYRSLLAPMLHNCGLTDASELGVLMCGSPPEHRDQEGYETPWTVFVDPAWLRWRLETQSKGYEVLPEVSSNRIYGCIPAWPDSFFEFLQAIVETDSTFLWQRHAKGYLVLSQAQ